MDRHASVLIVEDDADHRELLRDAVESAGWRAAAAEDAATALDLARRERPDLVVSDFRLRGGTADEMIRALRADPGLAAVPVLLVSAEHLSLRQARDGSLADDFLPKPFRLEEFLKAAAELLARGPR